MPVRILNMGLTLSWWSAIALTTLAIAFVAIAPLVGQPLETGFTVSASGAYALETQVSGATGAPGAVLRIDQGDLLLVWDTPMANGLRALDVAVTGGFWILVIGLLRRVCWQAASDRPFSLTTAHQLGLLGLLLLLFPIWQGFQSFVWQALLLAQQSPDGALVHSFAALPEGGGVRLLPRVDFALSIAGLLMLVVAQAFRVGVEVQRDSDEVV